MASNPLVNVKSSYHTTENWPQQTGSYNKKYSTYAALAAGNI